MNDVSRHVGEWGATTGKFKRYIKQPVFGVLTSSGAHAYLGRCNLEIDLSN